MYQVRLCIVGVLSIAGLAHAGEIQPNLIQNGSFEISTVNPGAGFLMLNNGNSSIEGWTVFGGGVDYIGGVWAASDGLRSLDINKISAGGGIQQTFSTVVGESYLVEFDMSGNMFNSPDEKLMDVSAAGESARFAYDQILMESTPESPNWTRMSWIFVADSTTTTLRFTGVTAGAYGAALDNVMVTNLVPAPSALGLLGVIGLVSTRRRR